MAILICEDEKAFAFGLQKDLQREGWSTLLAHTGAEAAEFAKSGRFELAVVDYYLPDTSGLEVAKNLHKTDPGLPVILISGGFQVGELSAEMLKDSGVSAMIAKPIDSRKMRELVRNTMRPSEGR